MKHLDLFSGIGGFALAGRNVWGGSYENVAFCDYEPFCQKVLAKNFPNSIIHGDIKKFDARGITADIVSGGFPCQPFSSAGLRKGTEDDRHLWPDMLRIIREVSPRWVVGENVRGFTNWNGGLVFDQVQIDLETLGYEVTPFLLPACAVNAPHRRDRIWFIAHAIGGTNGRTARKDDSQKTEERIQERDEIRELGKSAEIRTDTHSKSRRTRRSISKGTGRGKPKEALGNRDSYAQDPDSERGSGRLENSGQVLGSGFSETQNAQSDWSRNWIEVATELCGVDDGLSSELDGLKLSKAGHRQARLKALGNAIVPQVAEQIFKAIKGYEES